MKNDIDRLMEEKDLDALFVVGSANHNSSMVYFTGIVHVSDAYLLKKRGEEPILFYQTMERDEADRTGLETKSFDDYPAEELITKFDGDLIKARAHRLKLILEDFDVTGRVSIYGSGDVGSFYGIFRETQSLIEGVELVTESRTSSVLTLAKMTKDEEEVEQIREIGEITVSTVDDVAGFLKSHQVKDGTLVNRQGEVLTIGEVKRRIDLWLAMRGAENPEGTIFAIGSDAGVPHSAGIDDQPVEIGKPIVFDIFPCQIGGGYFYDFTRTWCLGHAPDEVQKLYDDVLEVYKKVYAAIEPSLAHGLGLDVHEGPSFYKREENKDVLLPGTVITVEPGLYYPERGMGARIEDTVWVRPDGFLETLVEYSMDLVLELEGV
jgi:Xaa-Pro aminopeptidase